MVHFKHHGKGCKSRYKSRRLKGERTTINQILKKFEIGQTVHIVLNPTFRAGAPFRRFVGKTGMIMGKQGKCYLVKIQDVRATKLALVHPAHLKGRL